TYVTSISRLRAVTATDYESNHIPAMPGPAPGVGSGCGARDIGCCDVRTGSERGLVEFHDVVVQVGQDGAYRGQLGQHVAGEELSGGDLAPIEGLGRTGVQCPDGDLGLDQQPPADEQVADGEQEPHRPQSDLVQLGGVVLGGHQVPRQGGDHGLD